MPPIVSCAGSYPPRTVNSAKLRSDRRVGVGDRRRWPSRHRSVKLRERHAFVSARLADMERQAPYAGQDTEVLQAQRDTGELEREDKRLERDAAISNRGPNSALARKLTRELDDITMREAGLREELSVREMQQANTELALHRARVHAERELRAEDEAALAGLEDRRRGKATEALRYSFDDRLAQVVGPTQERLIAEAEATIGSRLLFGPSAPDKNVASARPLSEMLAEAEEEPAEDTGWKPEDTDDRDVRLMCRAPGGPSRTSRVGRPPLLRRHQV